VSRPQRFPRGQQRGDNLDALPSRKGKRWGRDLGRALFRGDLTALSWKFLTQLMLRRRVTNGPGSRAASVAMAFTLIESAQTRWQAVNAPHLVAPDRAARYSSKLVERPDGSERGDQQLAGHTVPQVVTVPPARSRRRSRAVDIDHAGRVTRSRI